MSEVSVMNLTERGVAPRTVPHYVDGQRVAGTSGRSGPIFNPATGEQVGDVAFASSEEVDRAVAGVRAAADSWASTSLARRGQTMFQIREVLQRNAGELADLIVEENGKTRADALGEVTRGLECVEFTCSIPTLLKGGYSRDASGGVDVHSFREPLGVVAGITPLNFPVMVPLWMMANAVACGNAFILKPSEKDPSAPVRLGELLVEAGLPTGVVNVVNGDKEAVDRLLQHPDVDAVSFVGSTPVAKYIYEQGTSAGKRVQALGGAKNHMIIFPDADLEQAADAAVAAAFGAAGERCMAVSVVVAVGDIAEPLAAEIQQRMGRLRVGPGNEDGVDFGPLINRAHRDRVASYLDSAAAEGAKVVVDGREHPLFGSEGFYLGPSLIDHVSPEMSAYRDEIFGPVLSFVRADSYDEALALVNENPYGNGTAIFTRDGGLARRFQGECNIGMVGVNVAIPVPVSWYSFGGWKASLFGDLHMYGPEGIQFFTRQKVVTTRWQTDGPAFIGCGAQKSR